MKELTIRNEDLNIQITFREDSYSIKSSRPSYETVFTAETIGWIEQTLEEYGNSNLINPIESCA